MRFAPVAIVLIALLGGGLAYWLLQEDGTTESEIDDALEGESASQVEKNPELTGTMRATPSTGSTTGEYVIRGTVVDEKGTLLPGVTLAVVRNDNWPGQGYRHMQRSAPNAIAAQKVAFSRGAYLNETPVGKTESDADGSFEFRVNEAVYHTVYARTEAPRAGGSARAYLMPKIRTSATVKIVVFDGVTLDGRVVDQDGNAMSASVYGYTKGTKWRGETANEASNGSFHFAAVPKQDVTFTVTLSSGLRFSGFKAPYPFAEPLVLTVPAHTGRLSGFVHTFDGEGISQADVTCRLKLASGESEATSCSLIATTDADGRFSLRDVPLGDVTYATAAAKGYLGRTFSKGRDGFEAVSVTANGKANLDLALSRGATVRGKVTDTDGGAPIEGAVVTLLYLAHHPPQEVTTTTDVEGRYTIDRVGPGRFLLLASHRDYFVPEVEAARSRGFSGGRPKPPEHLTLELTSTESFVERDLTLTHGVSVSGTVLGPNGDPVAGASVHAKDAHGNVMGNLWHIHRGHEHSIGTSASDGTFTISGLAPRSDWIFYARKIGFAGVFSDPVSLQGGAKTDVELSLTKQCVIRGTVLGANGEPIPTANVFAVGNSTLRGGPYKFTADALGRFEVHSMPATRIDLSVNHDGESVTVPVSNLTVGQVREGVIIRLGTTVEVTGVVYSANGTPVPRLPLYCSYRVGSGSRTYGISGRTNDIGEFTIRNLKPGRGNISVRLGNRSIQLGESFDIPIQDLRLTYDPRKEVSLQVTVIGADGKPIPHCDISVASKQRSAKPTKSVNVGTFLVYAMGEPPYRVRVSNPRSLAGERLPYRIASVRVNDSNQPLEIRLKRGVVIEGTVVDEHDNPIMGATVRVGSEKATTGPKGTWKISGIADEPALVAVTPPKTFLSPPPQVAKPGANDIVFRLRSASFIRGRVVVPKGTTLNGGSVLATWSASDRAMAGSTRVYFREDGNFELNGIPPNTHVSLQADVFSFSDGSRLAPTTVTNIKSGISNVVINVQTGVSASGVVVDAKGNPLPDVYVTFSGGLGRSSHTDRDGVFRLSGLVRGAYRVEISLGKRRITVAKNVPAPASNLKFVFPGERALSGTIRDLPEGVKYVISAWDTKTGALSHGNRTSSSADGSWTMTLPDKKGTWVITAHATHSGTFARSEPISAGEDDVVLVVKQGETIEGRVALRGTALPRARVTAKALYWSSSVTTDAAGAFKLEGLPPGTYTLTTHNWATRLQGVRKDIKTDSTGVVIVLNQPFR